MKANTMAWHVFRREIIDQWRDRRTLLTVIFLPLLLYPILGIGMLQMVQFMGEKPTRVIVVGGQHLDNSLDNQVPLFGPKGWNAELTTEHSAGLLQLEHADSIAQDLQAFANQETTSDADHEELEQRKRLLIQQELNARSADVLLWISAPPAVTNDNKQRATDSSAAQPGQLQVKLFQNSASDPSRVAAGRVETILVRWYTANQEKSRATAQPATPKPFHYAANDLAPQEQIQSQLWSRILPFILFLWTLTGAFYAAVDGCAGEKERGTLEALLVTPATRREIVLGKLWTTMTFSLTSGLVNLIGTLATGVFVASQLAGVNAPGLANFGPPPVSALAWLVVGAIPISALFSAISLSVASFARSSKEGQHYLLPILMASLPLLTLPLLPGVQMDLGMSLVPISGLMFWLRALIEGEYWNAARFTLPIFMVNGWCVYLAISWAVVQFQQETVLFRPVERFSLTAWLTALFQRRHPWPTLSQVIVLVGLIGGLKLFLQGLAPHPSDWPTFVAHTLIVLSGAVAVPSIVLALTSTRSPLLSLGLRSASPKTLVGTFMLAICFHPLVVAFQQWVLNLYPLTIDTGQMQGILHKIVDGSPGMWAIVLLMAVAPAICEELAFRGFILNGLRQALKPVNAILISAVLFGAMHGLLQQSIVAAMTGIILGFVALKTGSLWPCIVYHATHNALTLQFAFLDPETIARSKLLSFVLQPEINEQQQLVGVSYAMLPAAFMIICGVWIAMNMTLRPGTAVIASAGQCLRGLKPNVNEATP